MAYQALTSRFVVTFMFVCLLSAPVFSGDWDEEFNNICAQTQAADSLSEEELHSLVERADELLPVIEASDDPRKKVYLFRLKKCRAMFEFSVKMKQ